MYLMPIYVEQTTTFDRLQIYVNSVVGTVEVRLGIYDSSTTYEPSNLVVDAGTISRTTSGGSSVTISQTLSAGLYWLAFCQQTAPTSANFYGAAGNQVNTNQLLCSITTNKIFTRTIKSIRISIEQSSSTQLQ
jgi:hypothetical protein